jgi:hypothetical protein
MRNLLELRTVCREEQRLSTTKRLTMRTLPHLLHILVYRTLEDVTALDLLDLITVIFFISLVFTRAFFNFHTLQPFAVWKNCCIESSNTKPLLAPPNLLR